MRLIRCLCTFLLIISFFFINSVYAYDFENQDNMVKVHADITEIKDLKEMYDDFVGELDSGDEEVEYEVANVDAYWWPIGSSETTTSDGKTFATGDPVETNNSSSFGTRGDEFHTGQDIASGAGEGVVNIIAAKSGVVIKPTEKDKIDCKNKDSKCTGYGNYVVIQHSDGNYTYYGHLHANSITVKAGDTVDQGQVIGKMGNSGNSTGTHLHFEVRIGEDTPSAAVNPLDYVSKENPRPKGSKGDTSLTALLEYITRFEGVGCMGQASEEGDNYIACVGNDGVHTIGHGVVWETNKSRFQARGVNSVSSGTRVSKEIIDDIQLEIITEIHDSIVEDLASEGIDSLKDYQINALTSQAYNGGYTVIKNNKYGYGFIENWKKYNGKYSADDIYKNKGSLWYDSLCRPYGPGTANELGLKRRRVSEWMMFIDGTMDHLESGFDPSKYAWPE